MRRLGLLGATVLLFALMAPAGRAATVGASSATQHHPAGLAGPRVSGSSAYVAGTFVWTGYPYRDNAVAYPSGVRNGANLIQMQLGLDHGLVHVRALLETLVNAAVPVLGVAFDTDDNPTTGAPSLPGGRWSASGPLGVEYVAVLSGHGARLLRWTGSSWSAIGPLAVTVSGETNVIEATVPLAPAGSKWRVYAVAGAADSAGHSWLDGGQPISDVAFVGDEPPANWQHARSDAVLSGGLPSATAAATVDWRAVAGGVTRPDVGAPASAPGFHTLVYRSALDLGEGIGNAMITLPGGQRVPLGNFYAGPYQPYVIWVPPKLPSRPPLVVYMHGFTQTHLDNATSFGPASPNPSPATALLGNGGFLPPAVVVFPLGRGEDTFYFGAAEQDVLDSTDDAKAVFSADPDRIVLSGVSMGGFGTYRIGVRYPDRWAALVPFIGTGGSPQYEFGVIPRPLLDQIFSPTNFPSGNAELLENLADLPIRMINGQVDPIVNNLLVTQDTLGLQQLGYDYRAWVLLRRQHEVVPALSNCVLLEALTHRRTDTPAHVVLSVEPSTFQHDRASGLDLRYDHAYWVSGVGVRGGVDKGTIDAVSLARLDRSAVATQIVGAGQNLTAGADLCGSNPAVRTGDAWREVGLSLHPGPPSPTLNGLRLSLSGLTQVSIDLTDAGVATGRPITLDITGDGAASLHLVGPFHSAVAVYRDGHFQRVLAPSDGTVTLTNNFVGTHTYVLT